MNFMQMISLIKSGGNPKELINTLAQNNPNPVVQNLVKQYNSGNTDEINKIVNNLMSENGMNEKYSQFKNMFGIK